MVYCGSGTETNEFHTLIFKKIDSMVYCGSGTETHNVLMLTVLLKDSMVYCGSGTETTTIIFFILMIKILWSTAEAVLRQLTHFASFLIAILWSTAEAVLRQALPRVSQLSKPCTVRAFLHRSGIISPPRFLPSRRTGKRIWISSKDKSPPLTTSARSPRASTNGVNSRPAGTSSAPSCRCSAPTDNGREERSGI